MANTVDKVLKIAKAEVGYLEKKDGNTKYLYDKTANAGTNNYTKYGYEMHKVYPSVMDYPAYWCDCFTDWCFYKAYGVSTAKSLIGGDFNDYTVASCGMYEKKGALGKTPKKGAQVFFTKNGKPSGCHHTGIVYDVDDDFFYTIEGNTSNASGVVRNGGGVAKKKYSISSTKGTVLFGYPKYDDSKKKESSVPKLAKCNPVLKIGSVGEQVRLLQLDLNYVAKAGLDDDGEFGSATERAVAAFQKKYSLQKDGEYGKETHDKLKVLLK